MRTSSPRPVRQAEVVVDVGDAVEVGRPVPELFGDEMDHDIVSFALALDLAAHAEQARAHDDAAVCLEDLGPDHEVGDAEFVLDGDEHHARGGARPLPHQHQAGQGEDVAVLRALQHRRAGNAARREAPAAAGANGCVRSDIEKLP